MSSLPQNWPNPEKNDFDTIKIRITYPKSSQILFGETFLWVITVR
jgi:hypothetical protein